MKQKTRKFRTLLRRNPKRPVGLLTRKKLIDSNQMKGPTK